jgi:hypothetical protein
MNISDEIFHICLFDSQILRGAAYAFGLPLVAYLLGILADMIHPRASEVAASSFEFTFYGSFALGIVFLLITGYMIFRISKTSNGIEHSLFVTESDR